MEDVFQAIEMVLSHWPFVAITVIFTVIGQVTSLRLFTKPRAYARRAGKWYLPWENQWFWWWGRETLPLQPIFSGVVLGFLWRNPENADPPWKIAADLAYFAGAGVASLFAWAVIRGYLKKRGIDIDLPGESIRPPAPAEASSKGDQESEESAEDTSSGES